MKKRMIVYLIQMIQFGWASALVEQALCQCKLSQMYHNAEQFRDWTGPGRAAMRLGHRQIRPNRGQDQWHKCMRYPILLSMSDPLTQINAELHQQYNCHRSKLTYTQQLGLSPAQGKKCPLCPKKTFWLLNSPMGYSRSHPGPAKGNQGRIELSLP